MLNLSHKVIKGLSNSQIAKNETNDCFVRALAAATGQDYDTAHKVASIDFNRDHKKGVSITDLEDTMMRAQETGLEVGNTVYGVKRLKGMRIKNYYRLYGKDVARKKSVKSFMKDNPKGSYIVTVSKHAFAVIDGKLVDNKGEEFRPTRKVTSAYMVTKPELYGKQLKLWG